MLYIETSVTRRHNRANWSSKTINTSLLHVQSDKRRFSRSDRGWHNDNRNISPVSRGIILLDGWETTYTDLKSTPGGLIGGKGEDRSDRL